DPALLRMAVRNLLDNAVRHGRGDIPAVVEVTVQDGTVTIHDYGPGVGASGPREGVGLSLARWVAELHDAELVVADHPNGGTVATLRLGAAERPRSA
ncbi:MAG: sensor histidine kinase, partial [Catenulispora sp.]|nr:sensor histidine kinase [Catenulispora sp.]